MKADAFLLRRGKDTDGLSVNLAANTNISDWITTFNACFAVESLHAGRIRNLCLHVVADPADPTQRHAFIVGLPDREESPTEAERLAGQLTRMCRVVWRKD